MARYISSQVTFQQQDIFLLTNVSFNKKITHMWRVGHTEFHFGIYWWTLKNPKKSNFWKNETNCRRYHHFTHVYQKPQSYEVQFLRYRVRQNFLSFWAIFCSFNPLPPLQPRQAKFWKNEKSSWRTDRLTDGRMNWWWFLLCKCLCSFPMASFVLFKM